ncbi:MAG TPA: monovalent cation/H(+) antiporter subunit G [Acidimicrobiales bacterium]|nr:monovalent cation/H(+) antiporter subunit G [Acidimicrobiales bacterium]
MDVTELIVGLLALGGAGLVLLAGVGVLRFDDIYARMHAATKAPTLGALLIGAAAIVALDGGRLKVALAVVIIFVTAPVASHMIGRAAYRADGVELHLDAGDAFASFADDPEPWEDVAPRPATDDPGDEDPEAPPPS